LNKLFCYEFRRLILNKLFFGILAFSMLYGWLTLTSVTIQGIANTAPFSLWSFGEYLSRLTPLICLGELFFLTFFTSRQEQRVAVITHAAPVSQQKYAAVRCGAVLLGTAVLAFCIVGLCWVFSFRLFDYTESAGYIAPVALILIPAVTFCLGLGWVLGHIHPALMYGLTVMVFIFSWAPLPQAVSFSMNSFFANYPRTLGILDPAFSLPHFVLCGRVLYFLAGVTSFLFGLCPNPPGALPRDPTAF